MKLIKPLLFKHGYLNREQWYLLVEDAHHHYYYVYGSPEQTFRWSKSRMDELCLNFDYLVITV
jgi:hypothetical protein